MSAVVWPSVIAVAGTLAGGLVAGLMQAGLARSARRGARADARREAVLTAVTGLVAALADHRRAMWTREELRLAGADDQAVTEARAASHSTRSAVTAPLMTVTLLAPALASSARQAVDATYALRDAADHDRLSSLRDAAITAADRLVESTARYFEDGRA